MDSAVGSGCCAGNRGEVVARTATAEEAVALVVAALPEGSGPAR
ncbi:DUF6193 family natural product biosynthesis protein [Kitasatospora sp. NPDC085879]